MTNVIVYTRFSPRRNADESESCEIQRAYCEKYAAEHDMCVRAVFDDPDVSGADEFRDKLWAAIDALDAGSVLLVYKRDRLARSVYLSEAINRAVRAKHATIVAVSGDMAGDSDEAILVRQVVAAIAEYERKVIASRTRYAMRHHMRAGRRMGGEVPYGFEADPCDATRMIPSPEEQNVLEVIASMRKMGYTYGAIVRHLNEFYLGMARHGKWNAKTVRKLCLRDW